MIVLAVSNVCLAVAFVWALLHERAASRTEAAMLLQRIQAPEVAVAQHAATEPQPVDDEDPELVADGLHNLP